jgi:hypothetical protein
MPPAKKPGLLDQTSYLILIQDGTLSTTPGSQTGTLCGSHSSGLGDYFRRVKNVKDAFMLGISKYAYNETVAKLDSDVRLIVDSIWPGFMQALKIYGLSIGAGAAVFGIAGAVLGEGAGAIPGALIGAEIGADIGTVILSFLGLKFLAEYILAHLDEARDHFRAAFKMAWEACGEAPADNGAAREFGCGIAALVSLVLQASVAWVLKKGLKEGLEALNKTETGRALAPYARIQYWRSKLGVTDAPVPRRGIAATLKFFDEQVQSGKLNQKNFTDEAELQSYWKATDFSREVKEETLEKGKILVGYRDPKSPFGYFYTEPGTFMDRAGIDYNTLRRLPEGTEGPKELVERKFIRYRVKEGGVKALKSICSGVKAHDTNNPAAGGATQYFIPRSWEVLETVDNPPKK